MMGTYEEKPLVREHQQYVTMYSTINQGLRLTLQEGSDLFSHILKKFTLKIVLA